MVSLELRDLVSNEMLEGILRAETNDSEWEVVRISKGGRAEIAAKELLNWKRGDARWVLRQAAPTGYFEGECIDSVEIDGRYVVYIKYFAIARLWMKNTAASAMNVHLVVYPLPPVPHTTDASLRGVLEFHRRQDPLTYLRQMQSHGELGLSFALEFWSEGKNLIDVKVPYSGEVLLSYCCDGYSPSSQPLLVHQGARVEGMLVLQEKATISGYVRDRLGDGVPNINITVCSRSRFGASEIVHRAEHEPGSPGYITLWKDGVAERVDLAQRNALTDLNGRYEVQMPFSGDVAAWVVSAGHRRGYVERVENGRYDDVPGLNIVLDGPQIAPEHIVCVNGSGEPLRNTEFDVVEADPPHPFQKSYPEIVSDEDGKCDIWPLEFGKVYLLIPSGSLPPEKFKKGRDGVVVFDNAE